MNEIFVLLTKDLNNKIINYTIYQNFERSSREYLKKCVDKIKKLLKDDDDEIYYELCLMEFQKTQYVNKRIYDIYYFIDNIFKDDEKFLDELYKKCLDFDYENILQYFDI